jgi:tRNA-2-methylthio-N6-dimethylallyladenosine synthase
MSSKKNNGSPSKNTVDFQAIICYISSYMARLEINPSPSVFIETYGCQMNKNDSELIRGILADSGYSFSSRLDDADIVLINTCSVREHAEERVLGRIGALARWKRAAPHRRLGILGCMAQRMGRELLELKPWVDAVVGPSEYRNLPELLRGAAADSAVRTDMNPLELYSGISPKREPGLCGWVTVSRGCSNGCAYCIVPVVRGPERPRPARDVEDEARSLADLGYREITLLGQNVNSYRDGDTGFPDLLRRVGRIPGIKRVRFMSSHPRDMSDALMDALAEGGVICPHLHLPVQSGSDRILERMRRGYDRASVLRWIDRLRRRIPGIGLSTDWLVGFPSETRADFGDTLSLVAEARFDEAFTYRYSKRAGTPAADMPMQVPEQEKDARLSELIDAQRAITLDRKQGMVGRIVEVLPERPNRRTPGEWMGRTPDNHVVVFKSSGAERGEPLILRIEACRGATLRGIPEKAAQTVTEENHVDS